LPKTQIQANTTGGHGSKYGASILTPHCAVFYHFSHRILGGIEIPVFLRTAESHKMEVNPSNWAIETNAIVQLAVE
jgi:hypothetical protein